MSKDELLPYFLAYGEVKSLTMDEQRLAAVVTFRQRAAAEAAIASLYNNFTVKGRTRCRVSWARRKGGGSGGSGGGGGVQPTMQHDFYGQGAASSGAAMVLPPKGGACASRGASAAPPGVRLPPGIKRPAAGAATTGAAPTYPSQHPDRDGTRPDR